MTMLLCLPVEVDMFSVFPIEDGKEKKTLILTLSSIILI